MRGTYKGRRVPTKEGGVPTKEGGVPTKEGGRFLIRRLLLFKESKIIVPVQVIVFRNITVNR